MLNKKAQGMPMNVVIIAIIVLVVLVIIIAFFAGGFSSITEKIRNLFTGQTSGQQRDIVVQTCQNLCDTAQSLTAEQQPDSGFCKQTFIVDHDSNPNTPAQKSSCVQGKNPPLSPAEDAKKITSGSLNIPCDVSCGSS